MAEHTDGPWGGVHMSDLKDNSSSLVSHRLSIVPC